MISLRFSYRKWLSFNSQCYETVWIYLTFNHNLRVINIWISRTRQRNESAVKWISQYRPIVNLSFVSLYIMFFKLLIRYSPSQANALPIRSSSFGHIMWIMRPVKITAFVIIIIRCYTPIFNARCICRSAFFISLVRSSAIRVSFSFTQWPADSRHRWLPQAELQGKLLQVP